MTLEEASKSLYRRLQEEPWLVAVGVTDVEIVVYAKKIAPAYKFLPAAMKWRGWPIVVERMDKVIPAQKGPG